ncbi:MAG: PAS domain S-box protein [Spirochaetales bacterium]|nr:PAS domain S-box protein [Spirochaetales bacterium]
MVKGAPHHFLKTVSNPAALFSVKGILVTMNEGFKALFGVTDPALLENNFNILKDAPWKNETEITEKLKRLFRGETVCVRRVKTPLSVCDKRFGLKKTDDIVLSITAFPVLPEKGGISYVVFVFNDISDIHEKQTLIEESEKRYRSLMEALPDLLFCVAPDQTVLFVNNYSAKMFSATPEQILGKKLSELFSPQVFERMWERIETVFRTGEGLHTENRSDFLGTFVWLDTWLVPLFDKQGKTYAIMGVSRDITEKVQYRDELEKTRNLESLGILAGGIAHDFNNILAAIQCNLSLLLRECASCSEKYPLLEQTCKAAEGAKRLTEQLLTFSKGGAPVKEESPIGELIKDSTGFVAHGSNVRFEYNIEDDIWPCEVDAGQISQVLQNLAINALQAMPGGGVVSVSAKNAVLENGHPSGKKGRFLCVSLRDRGTGIPEEYLEKVFIPFFTTKTTGNGLGLSICYSIIKRHGGFISLESKEGEGTTVHFFLPAGVGSVPEKKEELDASAGIEKKGKRILVIDDEAMVRMAMENSLGYLGCEPVVARNGDEGIALFQAYREKEKPFHAVILDLTIPGSGGGSTIIGELKKIDPEINAIVTSGFSNSPVLASPGSYGFKAVLRKPFTIKELEMALDKVLCR